MPSSFATEKRGAPRVEFSRGVDVHMVAIDGAWTRKCQITDVAESGAKLTLEASIEGLTSKEFFLLFSTTGAALRRCELVWINGNQIGVHFLGRRRSAVEERRRQQRTSVSESAYIAGDGSSMRCRVINLSDHGAAIEIADKLYVRSRFKLMLERDRIIRDCRVIWSSGNRIGVEFVD